MKNYVVITTVQELETELFGDIILVTTDKDQAADVLKKVENREPIPGLDYDLLVEFEGVVIVEHESGVTLVNS